MKKGLVIMKIYSFDGKKKNIDNFDLFSSPLFLGQKYDLGDAGEDNAIIDENELTDEKTDWKKLLLVV